MKRWALIVAILYSLMFVVLTAPAILLAFVPRASWADATSAYVYWPYWLGVVVMIVCQVAFLAVPVRFASRRPVTKRALWPTLLAGGLMFGGLVLGASWSLIEFALSGQSKNWINWIAVGLAGLAWCAWAVVFSRLSKSVSASDLVSRQCRVLLKGSILELLIAVPTHVVARYRDYCCAGFMTFIGLTTGIAVMLISFGPAVFFLFAERWRRLHPERTNGMDAQKHV